VALLAVNVRQVLGLPVPEIKEGEEANLTLFVPHYDWTFTAAAIGSKSSNTPFLNHPFRGKVLGIINRHKSHISELR
jgi:dihydroorotase